MVKQESLNIPGMDMVLYASRVEACRTGSKLDSLNTERRWCIPSVSWKICRCTSDVAKTANNPINSNRTSKEPDKINPLLVTANTPPASPTSPKKPSAIKIIN